MKRLERELIESGTGQAEKEQFSWLERGLIEHHSSYACMNYGHSGVPVQCLISSNDAFGDFPAHISETEIPAGIVVGKPFVIQSK